jgi:hypothetical protein
MTDHDAVRDDIAFMRALAEEGRSRPIGGSILVASGLSFGSASLAVWIGATWRLFTAGWQVNAVWFVSLAVFMAYLLIGKAIAGPTRGQTPRAIGVAWSGAGWSIFFVGLSLVVMAVHGKDGYVANAFLPFILCIYGSAWFVAAALTRARWLYAVAFGSFAMALVTAWAAAEGNLIYLIYALSLYALTAAPGIVLVRQSRRYAARAAA